MNLNATFSKFFNVIIVQLQYNHVQIKQHTRVLLLPRLNSNYFKAF